MTGKSNERGEHATAVVTNDASTEQGNEGSGPEVKPPYQTRIEMKFEPLDDGGTFVTIAETGWREDEAGRKSSYLNCEGWSQMLACMKAYVEYGINLRDGYYRSEMKGEKASPDNHGA